VKEIFLGPHSRPVTIDDEAFTRIVEIVNEKRVCERCARFYQQENPCVAVNTCLACFLRKYWNQKRLAFAGEHGVSSKGNYPVYKFLDADGYVYLTDQNTDDPRQNNYETLLHYGFLPPITYRRGDKEWDLKRHTWWSLYGNFRQNPVIVAHYYQLVDPPLEVGFLLSKDGTLVELNRRIDNTRRLFDLARRRAEATRDQRGYYHGGRVRRTTLSDSILYALISDIASEEYAARKKKSFEETL
jgi:hypothetical protein